MAPTLLIGRLYCSNWPHLHSCSCSMPHSESSPRINVLLCHQREYDVCNAAEWVRSVKSSTRSISGRNLLAGVCCLDTPETKKKKKRLRHRFYTWLCSLDSHPCLLLYTYIHSFEGLYCSRHLEQFQMFLTAFWIVFIYEWNITYGCCLP